MAFTYQNPAAIPRDAVRFWCGDTDPLHAMLQDEEIEFCLGANAGNVLAAALMALKGLAAKYALIPNESVGPVSVQDGGVAAAIQKQIGIVKAQVALGATIEFGGVYTADVVASRCNPGIVQPAFTRDTLTARDEPGVVVSNERPYGYPAYLSWWEP